MRNQAYDILKHGLFTLNHSHSNITSLIQKSPKKLDKFENILYNHYDTPIDYKSLEIFIKENPIQNFASFVPKDGKEKDLINSAVLNFGKPSHYHE